MINGAPKIYVPFWLDADAGADDPYTSECFSNETPRRLLQTNETNPHAYSEFTIVNGELDYQSIVCVEKAPGNHDSRVIFTVE